MHSVHSFIFEQELVIFGDGDQEKDSGDILEAVDPLLSLGTLSTNVEHAVGELFDDEGGLGDTGGLDTRAEDILVVWQVVGLGDARDGVEVAKKEN